jgi:glycosyltransferase involved in cell wall biosynthesis
MWRSPNVSRICLYYRQVPERDRWVRGDRFVRPLVRRVVRGRPLPGGIDKVFINLRLGLDRQNIPYEVNLPFGRLRVDDRVAVLGRGRSVLLGYDRLNPIVAGNGLMTHPSEWPNLCNEYPVAAYVQPSAWAKAVFEKYYGSRCRVWPVGIDTEAWRPEPAGRKTVDVLVYDKIRWRRESMVPELLEPIRRSLQQRGLSHIHVRYGAYSEEAYKAALGKSRFMIFLCEHESQGLACEEALASGVPVLAWDQGWCLDPDRFAWGEPEIPATSVPYFDRRCGLRFRAVGEFSARLDEFLALARSGMFAPRQYVLENLTLEACAARFVDILNEVRPRVPARNDG